MSKKAADVTSEDGDAGAPKRSRKRNKKPKDMPKRPLSAYNLFFADERERILSAQRQGVEQPDFILPSEEEAERQKQVGKKRAPILFQALARCVGKRWGGLDAEAKKKYEVQAEEEMKKYRVRMEEYQQNIVMNTMAQSAKQKRKKDKNAPGEDSLDDSGRSRPAKRTATGLKTELGAAAAASSTSSLLSATSSTDGAQVGGITSAPSASASGMSLPPGIAGLSQMTVPQQQQFHQSGFLSGGLGGAGGAGSSVDSNTAALFSSQLSNQGLGTGASAATGAASLLPPYQQFAPYFQQQQQQQQQGLGGVSSISQQGQGTNSLLLEQVLLQQQRQQQAAALMSGGLVGGAAPADLLALQLQQQQQQQPQQQMLQTGNQSALFNYLQQQQQPQQQQPCLISGAGAMGAGAGVVGGMDLSNPPGATSVQDLVGQQQQSGQRASMWDSGDASAATSVLGGGVGADGVGAATGAPPGGMDSTGTGSAAYQQAFALLQPQQLQQLLVPQEQQSGLQSFFNPHHHDPTTGAGGASDDVQNHTSRM